MQVTFDRQHVTSAEKIMNAAIAEDFTKKGFRVSIQSTNSDNTQTRFFVNCEMTQLPLVAVLCASYALPKFEVVF